MSKIIYLITDGTLTPQNFLTKSKETFQTIEIAIENRISLIQIREKQLPAKLTFELTQKAVKLAQNSNTKILINDRADVALAASADGVHLTANSISSKIIRSNFPRNFIIGVSAHTLEDCRIAKKEGADFAVLGPIFSTPNKSQPIGLEVLRQMCKIVKPFSIIGLGGIDETNYKEVLKFADGIAAIRFLNNEKNLRKLKNESLPNDSRS